MGSAALRGLRTTGARSETAPTVGRLGEVAFPPGSPGLSVCWTGIGVVRPTHGLWGGPGKGHTGETQEVRSCPRGRSAETLGSCTSTGQQILPRLQAGEFCTNRAGNGSEKNCSSREPASQVSRWTHPQRIHENKNRGDRCPDGIW